MRKSFDCSPVNDPKTIAGIEWKLVVIIFAFFTAAAVMEKAYGLVIVPFLILIFLRGPGKKDSAFIQIYRRHRVQRERYSPAYITAKNFINPRPIGFSRSQSV